MTRRKKKKTGSKGWWAILAALLISGVFAFYNNPAVSSMLNQTEQQVLGNEITPFIAAKRMMDLFLENISNTKLP